jgi:hypothetical protein
MRVVAGSNPAAPPIRSGTFKDFHFSSFSIHNASGPNSLQAFRIGDYATNAILRVVQSIRIHCRTRHRETMIPLRR